MTCGDRQARCNLIGTAKEMGMIDRDIHGCGNDPYDLNRFVEAQEYEYASAISEIRNGRKISHWMWYIFPQFDGLGFSPTSKRYAIKSIDEAQAYLVHPILGLRLQECCEAALSVQGRSAHEIFGSPDDMKLRSCVTLFARVSPSDSVFERVLEKYFNGRPDHQTLRLSEIAPEAGERSEFHT
jgi:uncharacterized protein (DUF1810 family)